MYDRIRGSYDDALDKLTYTLTDKDSEKSSDILQQTPRSIRDFSEALDL